MKNTQINRAAIRKVAHALGDLNRGVVYVGGAVISHYVDDPAAEDVRPTKDIDIFLEIASVGDLERLREKLHQKGFTQSFVDEVVCRFRFDDIKVDVMATQAVGWAPANPWFGPGFSRRFAISLDGVTIWLLPLPYFLAAKFVAFYSRGNLDARASHDFEDIVYLLNHVLTLQDQILQAKPDVKGYLTSCFQDILGDVAKQEAILAHLFHEEQMARYYRILDMLEQIVDHIGKGK
ncbi:MAG: nucleotidyl transferase AbiEii/AbiGii toxin family protein [Lewinella sp.]|nr:nucleotidyl transferase AbiEii/AbiGii toxin family protein [Lewinella sp.]